MVYSSVDPFNVRCVESKAVFAKPVMGRKVAAGYHWQLATDAAFGIFSHRLHAERA
jgi:hypothetical protein